MNKTTCTFVAALLLLAAACGPSAEDAPVQRSAERISDAPAPAVGGGFGGGPLGGFKNWRAMGHIRRLADDIGVRVRATEGERRGANYVANYLSGLGYEVRIRTFEVDGGTSRNVVAWWPGASDHPFVLGGHIDTVAGSPGANDNASGVAVLLEVARIVRGKQPARYLKFVAFGSEEYGSNGTHHVGSQVFVNRMDAEARRKIPGMISVDMIADGRPLIIGTAGIGPDVVARSLYNKLDNAGFNVTYRVTCDCSDNGPFEHANIPAAFMWSGVEPNYHDPSDTVPNLQRGDVKRTGRAVRHFADVLNRRLIRRYRAH